MLEKIATPGDVVAACLGGVVGYLVGIYLSAHNQLPQGVSVGDIGIIGLIAIFGLKKLIFDVLLKRGNRTRGRLRTRSDTVRAVLADLENSNAVPPNLAGLRNVQTTCHRLWLGGSINDSEFLEELERVENAVKQHLQLTQEP